MFWVPDIQLIQVLLLQELKGVQILISIEQEGGHVLLGGQSTDVGQQAQPRDP